MSFEELLGYRATLTVRRWASPGAYLALDESAESDVILLPGAEVPKGVFEGDPVDVFVHQDSQGRPIATTRETKLQRGEVAFLRVTAVSDVGAFVDWGPAKELLVPFAEQTLPIRPGERHPIGLYVDRSGRLAGTMRISEMLRAGPRPTEWALDEWVDGEAWRNDPDIGLFVIVEKSVVGLVPKTEPHSLTRGAAGRFRIANILPDGKLELSLRGHAHEELNNDAQRILAALARPNPPSLGDKSSPDEIRAAVGLSKKAFKRAVGRLLSEGAVVLGNDGVVRKRP